MIWEGAIQALLLHYIPSGYRLTFLPPRLAGPRT